MRCLVKYKDEWKEVTEFTLPLDAQAGGEVCILEIENKYALINIPKKTSVFVKQGEYTYEVHNSFELISSSSVTLILDKDGWHAINFTGTGIIFNPINPEPLPEVKMHWFKRLIRKIKGDTCYL